MVRVMVCALMVGCLAGCTSAQERSITWESAGALAPYIAAAREAQRVGNAEEAQDILDDIQSVVGPARPSKDTPAQRTASLAKISKTSKKVEDEAKRQNTEDQRWDRQRSIFWYVLLAGLMGSLVCVLVPIDGVRDLAGFPAAAAVVSGLVLLLTNLYREVVGDLVSMLWLVLPALAVVAALGGAGWLLWRKYAREAATLGAVVDGVELAGQEAKESVAGQVEGTAVQKHLESTLVARGLSKKKGRG